MGRLSAVQRAGLTRDRAVTADTHRPPTLKNRTRVGFSHRYVGTLHPYIERICANTVCSSTEPVIISKHQTIRVICNLHITLNRELVDEYNATKKISGRVVENES